MLPRDKFITALKGGQVEGRVPHFELVFYLTMEAFGKLHPTHRNFYQWKQMSEKERGLHRRDIAETYIMTAKKYEHSAIFCHSGMILQEEHYGEAMKVLEEIRELSGDEYFLMMHGDATYEIPEGDRMVAFVNRIADDRQAVLDEAKRMVETALKGAEKFKQHGALDGFALCSDYCLNTGPFLSPAMFDEFVTPYLAELIAGYRSLGLYSIKHTDGNIMPILDSLVETRPDALHSIDPQAGVDIAEVKRLVGDKVCLIGNVNCGLMDTGTDEEVVESARYALKHGMPGGGYIFSTSNCVYTGMDLERYELMVDVWRKEGNY